jgi:3-hydroxyacyl-CoA dehydrogenase
MVQTIRNVSVFGAGIMGSGIAQVCITAGYNVTLVDTEWSVLNKARENIRKGLEIVAGKTTKDDVIDKSQLVNAALQRLTLQTNVSEAVTNADIVIEAIVENLEAKQNLFKAVEDSAPNHCLLATNTSSLKLSDIGANLKRKQNFGGIHFFNPVPIMPVVEVIRTDHTSQETFTSFMKFSKKIGKKTIVCKDTIGFVVNRILIPLQNTALGIVDQDIATPEDVDLACRLALGFPIGPFALLDVIGLDTAKFIQDGWIQHYRDEIQLNDSPTLNRLVAEGKLGRKTGEGFYKYRSKI